jgi:hypothetical protein
MKVPAPYLAFPKAFYSGGYVWVPPYSLVKVEVWDLNLDFVGELSDKYPRSCDALV